MSNLDSLVSIIKRSQKTLFILCGYPYSGKSYVANQLQIATGIEVVAIDAIFKSKGFDWDTSVLTDHDGWQIIFAESYKAVGTILERGKNVLYDSTNQTVASRDALLAVAKSMSAKAKVVYIKSSINTVWKR